MSRMKTERLFTGATILAILLLGAGLVFTLHALGRVNYCQCGLRVWTPNAWSTETSQDFADPYSLSHILHGLIFFWVLRLAFKKAPVAWLLVAALAVETGWEIFENSEFIINKYRYDTASLNYFGDSILNSLGDVSFTFLGFWFAWRYSWKASLAVLIALEVFMVLTIRDNLTLNILMLIHPVPAIQHWQLSH